VTSADGRLDVVLNHLCLTRSRSEAKAACEAGAVLVDGHPARASQTLKPGQAVTLRFATRTLEVRVDTLPPKSISKKAARELYEVLRDEPSGEPRG
jgi:ribosomal 50S subunit-recycling heat shock protein